VDTTSTSKLTLLVQRTTQTVDAFFGRITVSGEFIGYSMERVAVAIPLGIYTARLRDSAHFGFRVPGIDVPNRTNIEIHPANYPSQLEGCIAIGSVVDNDALDNSRAAFERMMAVLPKASTFTVQVA